MKIAIEFSENIIEYNLPIIRLTKSKNKTTGTATFIFFRPKILNFFHLFSFQFQEMSLVWEEKKIKTTDVNIFFLKENLF